jgi:hypothetical protein
VVSPAPGALCVASAAPADAESGVGRARSSLERPALCKGVDVTLRLRLIEPLLGLDLGSEIVLVPKGGDFLSAELAPFGRDLGAHALG